MSLSSKRYIFVRNNGTSIICRILFPCFILVSVLSKLHFGDAVYAADMIIASDCGPGCLSMQGSKGEQDFPWCLDGLPRFWIWTCRAKHILQACYSLQVGREGQGTDGASASVFPPKCSNHLSWATVEAITGVNTRLLPPTRLLFSWAIPGLQLHAGPCSG